MEWPTSGRRRSKELQPQCKIVAVLDLPRTIYFMDMALQTGSHPIPSLQLPPPSLYSKNTSTALLHIAGAIPWSECTGLLRNLALPRRGGVPLSASLVQTGLAPHFRPAIKKRINADVEGAVPLNRMNTCPSFSSEEGCF